MLDQISSSLEPFIRKLEATNASTDRDRESEHFDVILTEVGAGGVDVDLW